MTGNKILMIDDEVSMHRLLVEEIKDSHQGEDINLIYAKSGQEGIDAYIKERPTLVLMDMHLPGMDGLDITKRIMAIDPKANIFLLTRYADEERTMMAIDAGARGFISKTGQFAALVIALIAAIIKITL